MRRYPTIPYPGGKGRLAPTLVQHLPAEGRLYVEPCVGCGNVFWVAASTLNYSSWWLNDTRTATLLRIIHKLGAGVRIPERTKDEYCRQRKRFKTGDEHSILLQPYMSRNGAGYVAGSFCSGHGPTAGGYTGTMWECHRLLTTTNARITNLDWQQMDLDSLTKHDTVFFDPPYYECDVRAYPNTFDHMAMVKLLCRAKFRWMLTEYDQDFYCKYLGKPFLRLNVQLMGTNADRSLGERRVECVWKGNY